MRHHPRESDRTAGHCADEVADTDAHAGDG
jgi:hypothetical protein